MCLIYHASSSSSLSFLVITSDKKKVAYGETGNLRDTVFKYLGEGTIKTTVETPLNRGLRSLEKSNTLSGTSFLLLERNDLCQQHEAEIM